MFKRETERERELFNDLFSKLVVLESSSSIKGGAGEKTTLMIFRSFGRKEIEARGSKLSFISAQHHWFNKVMFSSCVNISLNHYIISSYHFYTSFKQSQSWSYMLKSGSLLGKLTRLLSSIIILYNFVFYL